MLAKVGGDVALLLVLSLPLASFASESAQTSNADESGNSEDAALLAKFQLTYVWQTKPRFHADYSGPNSLRPGHEKSYTFSATGYLGARLWEGAALYANPEVVQGVPLSGLVGLGGETNGEAQKVAGSNPTLYRARLFVRQTIGLGGRQKTIDSGLNQLAETVDGRRVVITLGNFALNDIFDNNIFSHDSRTQFLNWTLMGYGGWDFAADARGFTQGVVAEFYEADWAIRLARVSMPKESNGSTLNARIFDSYGDNAEIECGFNMGGKPGKARLLAYRNVAEMGTYTAANTLGAETGTIPDISLVRTSRSKTGWGTSVEQSVSDNIGLFARYSTSDGNAEEYSFAEVDQSSQLGLSIKGQSWSRADDTIGLAVVRNKLSSSHQKYLSAGGQGFFLGDGQLSHYHPEEIAEGYYSVKLISGLWATLDYQHINNPAYNAGRGPVVVYTARLHAEF